MPIQINDYCHSNKIDRSSVDAIIVYISDMISTCHHHRTIDRLRTTRIDTRRVSAITAVTFRVKQSKYPIEMSSVNAFYVQTDRAWRDLDSDAFPTGIGRVLFRKYREKRLIVKKKTRNVFHVRHGATVQTNENDGYEIGYLISFIFFYHSFFVLEHEQYRTISINRLPDYFGNESNSNRISV